MTLPPSALFVDLYELTMGESYLAEGLADRPATFQLYTRRLPQRWGCLVAAGLDEALEALERVAFTAGDLAFLEATGLFGEAFLRRLERLRFSGDVRAMPEGTAFFPDEPVLEVTAPLLEAQLAETALLNIVHFQSLIASKALRCVVAARGRRLVEFGARRAHGREAGARAARSSYLAGFDATSNVEAGWSYGIPLAGTMAHSFVECFAREEDAFDAFVRAYPRGATLLVDTYDTIAGARRAARVAAALAARGGRLAAVRLDSGDLLDLSRRVRAILDEEGLPEIEIFASGGLDEHDIADLVDGGASIDGFGVGSRLVTAADAPSLDMAYKLVGFDGRPVLKLSAGKATLPCPKQVWRAERDGRFTSDVVTHVDEPPPEAGAVPLLIPAMRGGERCHRESLETARERCVAQRAALDPVTSLVGAPYPVEISACLRRERDAAAAAARRASQGPDRERLHG